MQVRGWIMQMRQLPQQEVERQSQEEFLTHAGAGQAWVRLV